MYLFYFPVNPFLKDDAILAGAEIIIYIIPITNKILASFRINITVSTFILPFSYLQIYYMTNFMVCQP